MSVTLAFIIIARHDPGILGRGIHCNGLASQPATPASRPAAASQPALSCSAPDVQQRSVNADVGAGTAEPAAAAGEAQDTAQVHAAGLLWDLCAAYPAAAFMLDNQLLDLLAAIVQRGSADGAQCNEQRGGAYVSQRLYHVTHNPRITLDALQCVAVIQCCSTLGTLRILSLVTNETTLSVPKLGVKVELYDGLRLYVELSALRSHRVGPSPLQSVAILSCPTRSDKGLTKKLCPSRVVPISGRR